MKLLDLTLSNPPANLALDEALIDWAEANPEVEALRFWESPDWFVVLGYSNQAASEARIDACEARQIPILRRCSGGGTVLQGPGCFNYTLALQCELRPEIESISGANCWIMKQQQKALRSLLGADVHVRGITDLTMGDVKFSGNAQRRKRRTVLFHGTILIDFDLPLIEAALSTPSREPEYRAHRRHSEFVGNTGVDRTALKRALIDVWSATSPITRVPTEFLDPLIGKYSGADWNRKF